MPHAAQPAEVWTPTSYHHIFYSLRSTEGMELSYSNKLRPEPYKHTCVSCEYEWETIGTGNHNDIRRCPVCGSFDIVTSVGDDVLN